MYTDFTLTTTADFAPVPPTPGGPSGDRPGLTGADRPSFGQVLGDVAKEPRTAGEPRTRPKASRPAEGRSEAPERTEGRDPDETAAAGEAPEEPADRAPAGLSAKTAPTPADPRAALRDAGAQTDGQASAGMGATGRSSGKRQAGPGAPVTAAGAPGAGPADAAGRNAAAAGGREASTAEGHGRHHRHHVTGTARAAETPPASERLAGPAHPTSTDGGAQTGSAARPTASGAAEAVQARRGSPEGASDRAGGRPAEAAAASSAAEHRRAAEAPSGSAAPGKSGAPVPPSRRADASAGSPAAGERVVFREAAAEAAPAETERPLRRAGRTVRGRDEEPLADVRRGGAGAGESRPPAAARGKAAAGEPSHSPPSPRPDGAGEPAVKSGGGEAPSPDNGAPLRVETASASRSDAAAPGRGFGPTSSDVPADVLRQVSQRLGQQLRQGGSEVRFALQPERLGQLNLQIRTEHNRVTVHILADTPAAKELIETHIGQLRADLSQQGLGLDAFDVDVATAEDGPRQRPNRQAAGGAAPRGALAGGERDDAAAEDGDAHPSPDEGHRRLVGVYA